MRLQQLLIPAIMGLTALTSQAYANQTLVAYKPSSLPVPQTPEKSDEEYFSKHIMKAILQKEERILEDIEINISSKDEKIKREQLINRAQYL